VTVFYLELQILDVMAPAQWRSPKSRVAKRLVF
jgi:hypothetical protein